MDMNELYGVIESMKAVIDTLMDEVERLSKRQSDLEHSFCEDIIGSMQKSLDEINFNDFKERCQGKLDKYAEFTKAQNGEDFDIYRQTYDGLLAMNKDREEPIAEADYVEATAKNIEDDMSKLQSILGADKIVTETTSEGTEISADINGETITGETAEEVIEKAEEKETAPEETTEEPAPEEPVEEEKADEPDMNVDGEEPAEVEESDEETEEEIEADLKALEEEMKKYR